MGTKTSKRYIQRRERLRRERAARIGYLLLWTTLALFLGLCLYVALR
jgi:hypothetical protein